MLQITLDEPHSGVCSASRVVSIGTEMFKPVADGKYLIGDSHVEGQFKDEKCNKDVNPTSRKCETFEGNLISTGANNDDLENCGGVKLDQKSLVDHQNISESTLVVTTSGTDVSNKTFPSKVLSSSTVFEGASVESQCNRKNNSDSSKDSTDLLKNNETFLGLESSLADEKNGSISKTCLVVDAGDETSTRKNSKTSADPIFQEKDSHSDSTSFSHQVKVSGKRVRFNLEENKPSGTQPSSSSAEITTKEPQMMFSDEEDGDNGCSNIDEDVSQRINRIQNLLRSDRLRTNRKRKYPVV